MCCNAESCSAGRYQDVGFRQKKSFKFSENSHDAVTPARSRRIGRARLQQRSSVLLPWRGNPVGSFERSMYNLRKGPPVYSPEWKASALRVFSGEGRMGFSARPGESSAGEARAAWRRCRKLTVLSDTPQRRVHDMGQYGVEWVLPAPAKAAIKGDAHASREEILNFDRNSKEIGRWNDTQQ